MQSSPNVTTTAQESRSSQAVLAIVVLALLSASYIVNAADRQVFPVLLPSINKFYGFTLAQGGFLATIFTLGIGVGGLPTGFLLGRFSRKTVILVGIALYSLFTLLTAVAFGFPDMATYRALSGVGEAMQNAALFSAVGAYFYTRRSLALGVLNMAYGIGGFIGPIIGANLLVSTGHWQVPFYVFGIAGFIFVAIILLAVSKVFTERTGREGADGATSALDERMPGSLLNRNTLVAGLGAAVAGLSLYGYLGLYPTYLQKVLHFAPGQAGLAASMFGIGSMIASVPAGYLGDRLGHRGVIIGSFLCAMIVGYVLFNVVRTPALETGFSFLEGAFASGFIFVNFYALIQRSVQSRIVGRASGLFVATFYLPAALAGYLFASLVGSYGWGGAAVGQLVLLPIVGIVAMLFVDYSRINHPRMHPSA